MRTKSLIGILLTFACVSISCKSQNRNAEVKDVVTASVFSEVTLNEWQEISGVCLMPNELGCACEKVGEKWYVNSYIECGGPAYKIVLTIGSGLNDCIAEKVKADLCELKF